MGRTFGRRKPLSLRSQLLFEARLVAENGEVPSSAVEGLARKLRTTPGTVRTLLARYGYRVRRESKRVCRSCGARRSGKSRSGLCRACWLEEERGLRRPKPKRPKKRAVRYRPPDPEPPPWFERAPSVRAEDLASLAQIVRNLRAAAGRASAAEGDPGF